MLPPSLSFNHSSLCVESMRLCPQYMSNEYLAADFNDSRKMWPSWPIFVFYFLLEPRISYNLGSLDLFPMSLNVFICEKTLLLQSVLWFSCTIVTGTWGRIFKLLRTLGIDSTESIPYNLSPFYIVMEQVTFSSVPLNVTYIRVLRDIAQFTVWVRVNICNRFHTWFQLNSRIDFSPWSRPKIYTLIRRPPIEYKRRDGD
jgi:hypothetical protein